jgi:hypothetical protein
MRQQTQKMGGRFERGEDILRLSATFQSGLSTGDRLGSLAWNIHHNFELFYGVHPDRAKRQTASRL